MTEREEQAFEQQLRQFRPQPMPEELKCRLSSALTGAPESARPARKTSLPWGLLLLRWLTPVAAVVVLTAILWRSQNQVAERPALEPANEPKAAAAPTIKADNIQIGEELVSSFDAVARLPSGEPVRFRVERWMDEVAVDDSAQGLSFERRMPRVVVTPVRFETY